MWRQTADKTAASANSRRSNLKIMTADEVQALCDAYFAACDAAGRSATQPGLALAIGVTPETLDKWACKEGEEGQRIGAEAIKKAYARMSDELQQRKDSAAIFLLKQRCYGGYSDDGGRDKAGAVQVNVSFGATDAKVAVKYGE